MKLRKRFGAMLVLVGMLVALMPLMAVAQGNPNEGEKVCEGLDSGKIDTTGDPETVTITADEGFLIDAYCVKAGNGPLVIVTVDPPQETVVIDHPTKDSVSHYSYSQVPDTTTTTTQPTTTTTEPSEPEKATTTTTLGEIEVTPLPTITVDETTSTTVEGETPTATDEEEVTTTTTDEERPTTLPFTGPSDVLPLAALATMLLASGGFVLRKASQ